MLQNKTALNWTHTPLSAHTSHTNTVSKPNLIWPSHCNGLHSYRDCIKMLKRLEHGSTSSISSSAEIKCNSVWLTNQLPCSLPWQLTWWAPRGWMWCSVLEFQPHGHRSCLKKQSNETNHQLTPPSRAQGRPDKEVCPPWLAGPDWFAPLATTDSASPQRINWHTTKQSEIARFLKQPSFIIHPVDMLLSLVVLPWK